MMGDANNAYLVAIFYVSWIFIGNFILLNLFLAILLDSFLEEDDEIEDEDEILAEKMRKKALRAQKKKKKDINKMFMDLQSPKLQKNDKDPSNLYFGEQKAPSEGEDLEDLDEE